MNATRIAACLGLAALGLAAPAASADVVTDTLTNLSTLAPALPTGQSGDYPSARVCRDSPTTDCVAATLSTMDARLAPLEQQCDHNAMFALLYDDVTRQYYNTVAADPNFFHSNDFVNNEDKLFGSYYFKAFDAYTAGDRVDVPEAWRVAFDSARQRDVTGEGDLLLGVNAHVRADLPFVLYRIGLYEWDGTGTKPDHDKVNQILMGAYQTAINDASQRLDPTVNPAYPPGAQDYGNAVSFQVVEAWREEAWRDAEALANSPSETARAQISREILTNAGKSATMIRNSNLATPANPSSARDRFCTSHQPTSSDGDQGNGHGKSQGKRVAKWWSRISARRQRRSAAPDPRRRAGTPERVAMR